MRRLHGLEEAEAFFSRRSWSLDAPLPPQIRDSVRRIFGEDLTALQVAERIIVDVRKEGDRAVFRHSGRIDGVELEFIEVSGDEMAVAARELPPEILRSLEVAAGRVETFQKSALPVGWTDARESYGEVVTAVDRAGIYVPAGVAPLASTVLMTAIPARVAGVSEVILCTPAPGGLLPNPSILAAASIAGVDRIFKIGGAQAIAAMALGTETVPAVDIVCGPGNIFTTAAKKLLYGEVGIDGIFGPTETLVIADADASAEFCAADLIAQAEHDPMARPVLVTTSAEMADQVETAMSEQLEALDRRAIAQAALNDNGAIVLVETVEMAVEVANSMAPEHLCLAVTEPERYVPLVKSAGGIFVGEYSAEVLGDYVAGPSHVMPTSGTARFASALSVRNFLRFTPVVAIDAGAFVDIGKHASELAKLEGLGGHAAAADIRLRKLVGE
jgi:histidinol dehydrogenase